MRGLGSSIVYGRGVLDTSVFYGRGVWVPLFCRRGVWVLVVYGFGVDGSKFRSIWLMAFGGIPVAAISRYFIGREGTGSGWSWRRAM